MPSFTDLIVAEGSIDDQISALEDFLRTLDPPRPEVPAEPSPDERLASLRRAKALIDEAIDLMTPHFP